MDKKILKEQIKEILENNYIEDIPDLILLIFDGILQEQKKRLAEIFNEIDE